MKALLAKIENLMLAITFAEAGEFETARETMLQSERKADRSYKDASKQVRITDYPRV